MQSGDRFRVRGEDGPGKDYTEEQTVDGLWQATMAGGVSNIWGNLTNPDTGKVTKSGNFGSFSYSDGTIEEISTWDRLFNDEDRFALDAKIANELTGGSRNGQYALESEEENSVVIYIEDSDTLDLNLSQLRGDAEWSSGARVIAVDTEKGYAEINLGTYALNDRNIDMGTVSDWAFYLTPADG